MRNVELLIIGAGPTGLAGLAGLAGLGAAVRCLELGVNNFLMIERAEQAGGLASSFVDSKGFVWDLGSHLQFSHYDKFDDYMNLVLKRDEWLHHQRASYVWLDGDFIPYPFQHNLHHLPPETRWECISGLLPDGPNSCVANFEDWIYQTFGEGMARAFFIPYNQKIWACPPRHMSHEWVSERLATPSLSDTIRRLCLTQDRTDWGPNAEFRYPLHGGTGAIWRSLAGQLPQDRLLFGTTVTRVDANRHTAHLSMGQAVRYENLLSTMPLDQLALLTEGIDRCAARGLVHTQTHIFGFGVLVVFPGLGPAVLSCHRLQ